MLISLGIKFLYVGPDVCLRLPSDSTSRWTPLPSAVAFPLLGWLGDLHPLEYVRAGRTETTLTADTVMHNSKLPLMYWFKAIHLLTSTKNTFSASEMQRQLGHKRYQPIWEMMHKLRNVMGKRDSKYTLLGSVEVDEGFFSTEVPDGQKDEPLKRGAGSQAKTKVLVMAESIEVDNPKKGQKPKKVGHIKMVVIPDSKKETIDPIASSDIDGDATVVSDGTKSHVNFPKMFSEYVGRKIDPREVGKVLPWVHIAISNSKSLMKNIFHGVKPEFLQEYLNEFCYKSIAGTLVTSCLTGL